MRRSHCFLPMLALAAALLLSACSGGSKTPPPPPPPPSFGLNAPAFPATVNAGAIATYSFSATADTSYTVTSTTASGSVWLRVYNGNPATGGVLIGSSTNTTATAPLNVNRVSFIAPVTGAIYITVSDMSFGTGSSYSIEAHSTGLTIGTQISDSTYNNALIYSFDATANTAYQVKLSPQTGNVNIASVNAKMTASIGASALPGTAVDSVSFLAPAAQRYYVTVSPTTQSTTFNLRVATTTVDPDLSVVVDSAVSNGTNVTINYTVRNTGINAAGAFNVDFWSNAVTPPALGAIGQGSAAIASLAAGATFVGTVNVPDTGLTGTAYAIVDSQNALVESDKANNLSNGVAWRRPLSAPQSFNFEGTPLTADFVPSGNAAWATVNNLGFNSASSIKAGTITHSQSTCFALNVMNAASVSFDYVTSSEGGFDFLRFYIDGVQNRSASGLGVWTNTGAIAVTTAPHEYKWCYTKDFTVTAGQDTAWVDNITFAPATPDLSVVVNSAVSNGTNVTVNYTVSNLGTSAAGAFNVDVWSSSAPAPVVGAVGQGTATIASLAAGATATGSLIIANAAASGTAYAIVDTLNAVPELNEANNVSAGVAWTAPLVAYNFDNGLMPAGFVQSVGSTLPWSVVAGGPVGSVNTLKAGAIINANPAQTSCVETTVVSTGVRFDYSVSSELGWDFLYFYVDGVLNGAGWSGLVPWATTAVITASATPLSHTYKWCYSKDTIISANLDTAWIDNINFY